MEQKLTRLKDVMKLKKMASVDLAKEVGVTPVMVSYWLSERSLPSLKTLDKIAQALDVPIWQLLASPEEVYAGRDSASLTETLVCPNCGKEVKVAISNIRIEIAGEKTLLKK